MIARCHDFVPLIDRNIDQEAATILRIRPPAPVIGGSSIVSHPTPCCNFAVWPQAGSVPSPAASGRSDSYAVNLSKSPAISGNSDRRDRVGYTPLRPQPSVEFDHFSGGPASHSSMRERACGCRLQFHEVDVPVGRFIMAIHEEGEGRS
jgi:hypothetical protein